MKCIHCDNELPKKHGWATKTKFGKVACMKIGCISYGLKPGSKQFQILVKNKSVEEVDAEWAKRIAKTIATSRAKGLYDPKNNRYSL